MGDWGRLSCLQVFYNRQGATVLAMKRGKKCMVLKCPLLLITICL